MELNFKKTSAKDRYKLLMSSVMPRPIALTTSKDSTGVINAAPFSYFNVMSATPPVLVMGVDSRSQGIFKDTVQNIRDTEEFVVNLVSEEMAERMNICAVDFPAGVSELDMSGLTSVASTQVSVPRIAESPVNLECTMRMAIDIGSGRTIVVGDIVHYHIRDDLIDADKLYIAGERMHLIGRMHGKGWYARTSDLFLMERTTVDEVRAKKRAKKT